MIFKKYFELVFWIMSLALLAFISPATDPHYSICVLKLIGINFCPGCGLGHSISYLFHGDLQTSLSAHPLGVVAVIIILSRIYKLLKLRFISQKTNHYAIRP
jgi:hypothetical protein